MRLTAKAKAGPMRILSVSSELVADSEGDVCSRLVSRMSIVRRGRRMVPASDSLDRRGKCCEFGSYSSSSRHQAPPGTLFSYDFLPFSLRILIGYIH